MKSHELRNLDEARLFLCQGLWLQRVLPAAAATVRPALEWALEIAAAGQPLPPPGFVADVGHAAFGSDWQGPRGQAGPPVPGVPSGLLRTYEDHVLGKLYADWTFSRAADALRRYQGRDRARGLAFLLNQFQDRAGFAGVELSPAVIKSALDSTPEDLLAHGWETLQRDGLPPLLADLYHELLAAVRRIAEVLAPEDLFELEHGTALDDLGQRLALRQVLQAAARLEEGLPRQRPRPSARARTVPTHILDEDAYPVGGYASLSNRGSLESLLHSQLAYMEPVERPDLFDIKFLRDELLYYARDENQFLRQRRTFVLVLYPDLVQTRVKDTGLSWQRGVLLLGLVLAAVRRLCDWLSTDALTFVVLFLREGERTPLLPERKTLETVLREQIANGTAVLAEAATEAEVSAECLQRARRSLCHCLTVSTAERALAIPYTTVTRLRLDEPSPALFSDTEGLTFAVEGEPLERWQATLRELLQRWV